MAEYVVSSALETFTILLARHPEMSYGPLGHQFLKIKAKLENLLPLPSDADARDQSSLKIWQVLARIREAAYKAVDVVETFSLKLNATRLPAIERALDPISSRATIREIKEITAQISEMATRLQSLGVQALIEEDHIYKRQQKVREAYFNLEEHHLAGMDSHVNHLSNLLLEGDSHGSIISIVGSGGVGKTTLAKSLYHNNGIRDHFECYAWVVTSQQLDYGLESILIQLTSSTIGLSSTAEWQCGSRERRHSRLPEMATKILQVLCTKRCLVVLDDVWDGVIFSYLQKQRISNAANSKIIVTTRYGDIAKSIDSSYLYELQCLDCERSWELFHSIAISKRDETDIKGKMISLGKKIITYCEGMPLIISLLAGLLSTKLTLKEWEAVLGMMMSNLGVEGNYYNKLLDLFYDNLPYYLKPCFLYFSQFDKGLEIPVKRLIQMWIADGVISTMAYERDGQKETMEDIAYRFLTELAERYMVLIGERGSTGKIKTCKMHDIMFGLAKWKAKQENFFDTIEAHRVSINIGKILKYDDDDIRREQLLEKLNPRARSLFFYNHQTSWSGKIFPIKLDVKRCRFLRVLCMENFKRTESILEKEDFGYLMWTKSFSCIESMSAKDIGDLALLRFLSLKYSSISELPPCIFYLRYIQSLDLRTLATCLIIPNIMWRTENLRHLYMHPAYTLKKDGKLKLGHLSKLQTLVNINDTDLDPEDVLQLAGLRKLVIIIRHTVGGFVIASEFREVCKFKNNTLSRLHSLGILNRTSTNVKIKPFVSRCCAISKMKLKGRISKLSKCHQLSANLAKLVIERTFLEEDPMTTLEKLPRLRVLFLGSESFMGSKLVCSERGFPQLQILRLHGLDNLKELRAEDGAVPLLSLLDIRDCPNLNVIPDKVMHFTTFRTRI
ncbi:hypothetical protein L6164_037187 [Bauhinia variegata]|uniref:Uncharacterized protein n=1 Tax=Bauhinia variegata TaxID=167791 RepID=A0ACB9KJA7_BAUVA|nr:hypothetical protein L6164_037187 [Bauhinia variegata]